MCAYLCMKHAYVHISTTYIYQYTLMHTYIYVQGNSHDKSIMRKERVDIVTSFLHVSCPGCWCPPPSPSQFWLISCIWPIDIVTSFSQPCFGCWYVRVDACDDTLLLLNSSQPTDQLYVSPTEFTCVTNRLTVHLPDWPTDRQSTRLANRLIVRLP